MKDLIGDLRQLLMPNCAKKLKESKSNRIEDFVAVSAPLGVTHIILFTATDLGTYMKLARLPRGPTLTFKLQEFSLARDVRASLKRPRSGNRDFTVAPLQVLNGFGASSDASRPEQALASEMLRSLFPPVDVPTFNQAECRRVALFHYDAESDGLVHLRHYSVARRQTGLQRGVMRLLNSSRLPKLGFHKDISDYILGGGGASESEAEDAEEAPGEDGGKIAVKLVEMGPRIALKLIKGEEGLMGGAVLFHRYQTRTPTEREVLAKKAREKKKLKERNKKLDETAQANKKRLKQIRAKKDANKKAAASPGEGEGEASDAAGSEEDTKRGVKRRFNPFSWKKKKKDGEKSTNGTVDFGTERESGGGGKSKGGGKTHNRVIDRMRSSQQAADQRKRPRK